MAEKSCSISSILEQISHLTLTKPASDCCFWTMILRRLGKRKRASNEKESDDEEDETEDIGQGQHEGHASQASTSHKDPFLSMNHSYTVLIGDHASNHQKTKMKFDCSFGDTWFDRYEIEGPMRDLKCLASGDENIDNTLKWLETRGFQFNHILAKGTFATIYLATSKEAINEVVFKFTSKKRKLHLSEPGPSGEQINIDHGNGSNTIPAIHDMLKRERSEIQYCSLTDKERMHYNINHPNVVQIEGYIVGNNIQGIVMEWCSLGSLDHILMCKLSGLLVEPVARRYFHQMLSAVEHIHGLGYIHRNINCAHFLIDNYDVIKLTNFALAEKNTEDYHGYDATIGSPGYRSPEFIDDRPYDGRLFDIWSLACCLFRMTTGRLPFGSTDSKLKYIMRGWISMGVDLNPSVSLSTELLDLFSGLFVTLPYDARFTLNRIKNTSWLQKKHNGVSIGNSHLQCRSVRASSSVAEEKLKKLLDI